MTSLPIRLAVAARPAPDVPEAATMTMSLGSASPLASSGARARIDAVA